MKNNPLVGTGHGTTAPIRPACHAAFGTRWAQDSRARPAVVRTHRARDSPARPAVVWTRPARDSRAVNGPGTPCRHPSGPRRAGHATPSSHRARHARWLDPAPAIRRRPTSCAGKPPNVQLSAAPLAGV